MELSAEDLRELWDKVEVGAPFLQEWDLLPREKATIKDLTGVTMAIMRACGGMDTGVLDGELAEQGLGDSKPNWEVGLGYAEQSTESEERIMNAVLRYRSDKLALDDIATETWSRLCFPARKRTGGLCEHALGVVFTEARRLLQSLSEQERTRDPRIQDEWGEQWMGTEALLDLFQGPPGGAMDRASVGSPMGGNTLERTRKDSRSLSGNRDGGNDGDGVRGRRHKVLDLTSMSEGLFYKALVANKLGRASNQDLETVRGEILLVGPEGVVTRDMGLLVSSPFSQLRSMYIVWDTAGVVIERRNGLSGAGGQEMVADDRSHRPAIPSSGTAGSGVNKRGDPEPKEWREAGCPKGGRTTEEEREERGSGASSNSSWKEDRGGT